MGCGGGLVVSVLAFYSHDPSSNPAEVGIIYANVTVMCQYDQMARLFVHYLPCNKKIGHSWFKISTKTLKKFQRLSKCCPSGDFYPNLVTLNNSRRFD